MERIITASSGQFTSRERDIMDAIKMKFCVINVVFYICWIPNLINGVLLWTLWFHLPEGWIITLWYIMVSTCNILLTYIHFNTCKFICNEYFIKTFWFTVLNLYI